MPYKIGDMAKFFGISVDTLRIYDKKGIVSPKKLPNGYRVYERDNMIQLAYVMHLRKTGLTLEEIRVFLNETDLSKSKITLQKREKLIDEEIQRLKLLKGIVHDYAESFDYALEHHGKVTVVDNVTIVYRESEKKISENSPDFAGLNQKYRFGFSFIANISDFSDGEVVEPLAAISNMRYALSYVIKDAKPEDLQDFSSEYFTILQSQSYVFSVIKCTIYEDYSEFNNITDYIKEEQLKINGEPIIRTISLRNGENKNVDYYSVYFPIESI